MGTTARGLPYPEATDFLAQGDDAIKALAQAVDALTKAGVTSSGTLAAGVVTAVPVTFATAFPAGVTPVVTTAITTTVPTVMHLSVQNITNTGFTLYFLRDTGTAAFSAQWIAVRP
jgi:hypothetical protein